MKTTLTFLILPLIGVGLYFAALSFVSKAYAEPVLTSGLLAKCPAKPNCVCSEYEADASHFIPPIKFSNLNKAEAIDKIKSTLQKMDATTISVNDAHVVATFTSMIFRFVDDFEIRLDEKNQLLHLRSASRTGSSDFGVNKKRVEKFTTLFVKNEMK